MHILFELCFPIPQSVQATIRHYSHYSYYSLFAIRHYSLFAIRDYSLFAVRYSRLFAIRVFQTPIFHMFVFYKIM